MLGRAMRAHQGKDSDELGHGDIYGPRQLKADFFAAVNYECIRPFVTHANTECLWCGYPLESKWLSICIQAVR